MDMHEAESIVQSRSESLSMEVKRWLDLNSHEHTAILVKTLLALRNNDGGHLIIGFQDDMKPDSDNHPKDVEQDYSSDVIQTIVSKYSSEAFEVQTQYPVYQTKMYVVIYVPGGLTTPVFSNNKVTALKPLGKIEANKLYCRNLSNGTFSTQEIFSSNKPMEDMKRILETCFDNRETSVASFIQRHLLSMSPKDTEKICRVLGGFSCFEANGKSKAGKFSARLESGERHDDGNSVRNLTTLLENGDRRYISRLAKRDEVIPEYGFLEVGLVFASNDGEYLEIKDLKIEDLKHLLNYKNPRLLVPSIWEGITGRGEENEPKVVKGEEEKEKALERLTVILGDEGRSSRMDFAYVTTTRKFYSRQAFLEDTIVTPPRPRPDKGLEVGVQIGKVVEAMVVGKRFAEAMGLESSSTQLKLLFRWKGLDNRMLYSWDELISLQVSWQKCEENEYEHYASIPLLASETAILTHAYDVVTNLLEFFDGFVLNRSLFDRVAKRTLRRG